VVKPWSIYVNYFRGVDGYAPRKSDYSFYLFVSLFLSLTLFRENQPIITQFDFDHVSPSLTKCRRRRIRLDSVAIQQQEAEKRPDERVGH